MKIDDRAEPLVRAAIEAAVKQDFARLDDSLKAFTDDELTRKAVQLTLSVILFVLWDVHHGKPTDAELREVADEIAEDESWSHATDEELATFLSRLTKGESFEGAVPIENIFILAFVCAANLLSTNRRDDEKWWHYLNRVETAIEAAG